MQRLVVGSHMRQSDRQHLVVERVWRDQRHVIVLIKMRNRIDNEAGSNKRYLGVLLVAVAAAAVTAAK